MQENSVPQHIVSSVTLFTIAIDAILDDLLGGVKGFVYADDCPLLFRKGNQ